jgi:hypothetical protein
MRIRWSSTHFKPPYLPLLLVTLASIVLTAREAVAAPIRYATSGVVYLADASIRFEGTEGVFEQGTLSDPGSVTLGRFVIDKPTSGSATFYENVPFAIMFEAPDIFEVIPGGPGMPLTRTDSSVLIQGHIRQGLGVSMGEPSLFAFVESVDHGSVKPITTGHIQHYSFPISLEDLKPTQISPVMLSDDEFDPISNKFLSPPVEMQTVPEPATVWVFMAGMCATVLYRRGFRGLPRSKPSKS